MRYPLESISSEEAVIGGLLLDPCVDKVMATRLTESDFTSQKLGYIFRCIFNMKKDKKPIDTIRSRRSKKRY